MKVIQQTGPKHDDKGQAQDALAGISAIPGFMFGYVNDEHRCVTFHKVASGGELQRGQREVELVFSPTQAYDHKAVTESLKPLADAIFGARKG
jgi:hypothetical protein